VAEPSTVNCGLVVPNTGDLVGTWGSSALNPDYVAIDGYLGGVQTISASSTTITLTSPALFTPTPGGGPTQAQNAVLKFTGTLTTNVVVIFPLPGMHIIHNLTQGVGSLVLSTPGGGLSISTPPGSIQRVYNDGTNVYFVDLPDIGSFLDLCRTTIPGWISACTVAPYLYCNGATFNGTTYPYLVGILGGTTLPDLRGRSRFFFNDTTARVTSGGSGINGDALLSGGGNEFAQSHAHGVAGTTGGDTPPHTHTLNNGSSFVVGSSSAGAGPNQPPVAAGATTISGVSSGPSVQHEHGFSVTSSFFGNGSSQNMPPAAISGMCFIRAG
jgi:hypothetical protein